VHGEGRVVRRAEDGTVETGAPVAFRAIPYALRANRAPTSMVVWLAESPDVADSAGMREQR